MSKSSYITLWRQYIRRSLSRLCFNDLLIDNCNCIIYSRKLLEDRIIWNTASGSNKSKLMCSWPSRLNGCEREREREIGVHNWAFILKIWGRLRLENVSKKHHQFHFHILKNMDEVKVYLSNWALMWIWTTVSCCRGNLYTKVRSVLSH